jgi:hypothetical protein
MDFELFVVPMEVASSMRIVALLLRVSAFVIVDEIQTYISTSGEEKVRAPLRDSKGRRARTRGGFVGYIDLEHDYRDRTSP